MPLHESANQRVTFARKQRRLMSRIEAVLWQELRDRRLSGWKFRRQRPVGPFVADFLCEEAKVIVEADGPVHQSDDQRARDRERDLWLRRQGFAVLRFPEERIMTRVDDVLREIAEACGRGRTP